MARRDLDWAVPGHLEAKVEHYLRATPKELRKEFMPLAETAKSVTKQLISRDRLTARRETLVEVPLLHGMDADTITGVRVPRENLLDRFAQVAPDGTLSSAE